ncbi:GNAT family N-acetyltransferase [Nocardioides jejuensis]|uniref:GNAT family N-acetyltransferase n=1 Tax=Nocardioides jejuensis TaxID=2502782 RepID=A0A4R1CJV1_9ACTN|nr:GNAT family N-acetyltransferase [Nocardioides jejuensis]TCJ30456.1 GNAT family N-acetyltransferase [Nocardioides jejuensis]
MEIVRVPYDHPDAITLMDRVQQIYTERYGGPDASPMDPAEFAPPAGEFFLGFLDGAAVATGAWRHVGLDRLGSTATAEVKRMYVVEDMQRRGLARLMLARLEQAAAAAGHDVLVLSTGSMQPEAIALYESSGYAPVPGWGVYADHPGAFFFGKAIAS